jgi:hypothetical protein
MKYHFVQARSTLGVTSVVMMVVSYRAMNSPIGSTLPVAAHYIDLHPIMLCVSVLLALTVFRASPRHLWQRVLPISTLKQSLLVASAGALVVLVLCALQTASLMSIAFVLGFPSVAVSIPAAIGALVSMTIAYVLVAVLCCAGSNRPGFWTVVGLGVYAFAASVNWEGVRESIHWTLSPLVAAVQSFMSVTTLASWISSEGNLVELRTAQALAWAVVLGAGLSWVSSRYKDVGRHVEHDD